MLFTKTENYLKPCIPYLKTINFFIQPVAVAGNGFYKSLIPALSGRPVTSVYFPEPPAPYSLLSTGHQWLFHKYNRFIINPQRSWPGSFILFIFRPWLLSSILNITLAEESVYTATTDPSFC